MRNEVNIEHAELPTKFHIESTVTNKFDCVATTIEKNLVPSLDDEVHSQFERLRVWGHLKTNLFFPGEVAI